MLVRSSMADPIRHPPDLRPADDERWQSLLAGTARDPLGRLAARVHQDLEVCVDRSVRRICDALDSYGADGVAPIEDLWWSLYRNNEALLLLLLEGRELRPEELAVRRQLGTRRARQGVPITDLLRAFRLGYSVFWETLIQTARDLGPEVERALMDSAVLVWSTLDEISSAVADAHRDVTEAQNVDVRRRALTFLDGVRSLPRGEEETAERARELGLDPNGWFVAAVLVGGAQGWKTGLRGLAVDQPDRSLVLFQPAKVRDGAEHDAAEHLHRVGAETVGVGLARSGLPGAQASLRDAERAFIAARALGRRTVLFRDHWLECLVIEARRSLEPLLCNASEQLADPDVSATVRAYLDADGKLTDAGERVHVHPNSVAYRLKRFAEITGVDVRTTAGANLAQAALALAAADRPDVIVTLDH